jgi:hypothetical protein
VFLISLSYETINFGEITETSIKNLTITNIPDIHYPHVLTVELLVLHRRRKKEFFFIVKSLIT